MRSGSADESELNFGQKAMVYACLGAVLNRTQRLAVIYTHSSGRTVVTKEDICKCLKAAIMDIGEQVEQVAMAAIESKPLPPDLNLDEEDALCVTTLYQKCMTELVQGRESGIKYGSFIQDEVMKEDGIEVVDEKEEEETVSNPEATKEVMGDVLGECGVDFSPQDIVTEIDACEEDWKEWTPDTITQQRMWEAVQRLE